MKKLLIILLIFTAFTASAQVYQRDPAYGRSIDRYEVLKDLGIPTFCGTPTVNSTVTDKAKIAYDSCGHKFYIYDPSNATWGQVTGGGVIVDSGVDSITYHDNQLCQWVDGVSTCYFLNKFYDSSALNYNQTKIIHFNTGHAVDSVSFPANNLNLYWPLYGDNADTSVHFKNDSLPRLDYAIAVRDTSEWNDNTLIDKLFLHDRLAEVTSTGITRTELQDTASAIRSDFPTGTDTTSLSNRINAKVNISDTAAMLSHYLLDAVAGTNVTIDKTNPQKPVINSSGGKDSNAIHVGYITTEGDTSIVFSDLKGNHDTITLSLLTLWQRNGNKIYYKEGNVGFNVDTPAYQIHVQQPSVNAGDNSGIYLQNTNTSSGGKTSPPLILGAVNNSSGTLTYRDFIIQAETPGSVSLTALKIYARTNYGTYTSPILSLMENGALTLPGIITQTAGGTNTFSGSVLSHGIITSDFSSAASQIRYNYKATGTASTTTSGTLYNFSSESDAPKGATKLIPFRNLYGQNLFNQSGGSTGFGVVDSVNASAKVEIKDTTSGFLLPRMTKAQRNKIISSITGSITSGGTGYVTNSGLAVSLTGGSGQNATAVLTISGGSVTNVTITNPGSGYVVGDVLSASITGSGFTYTISSVGGPAEGLLIYQTDNTPGPRYYVGGTWYKTTLTAD